MKKFLKIMLWIIVAAIFVGTFYYLYQNSQPKEVNYETVTPTVGDIERTTVLTGKIEPRDEIDIKPQISGIITEILVEAGQTVREGDVIARIKVIPEASQLSSAQNRVDVARIALDDARAKHERNSSLYNKKIISREEYETTSAAFLKAEKELESAIDALAIVRDGVSKYNASESNTMVRATITGLVLNVPVKVGSSVIQANTFNDGTTVATIADMSNLIFKGKVDETEVGSLAIGMPMTISIGALPDVTPTATIEYISPKGTDSNGANTFEIKAALDLPEGSDMRAGYSANATISLSRAKGVTRVPEGIIEYEGDSTYVYLVTDSAARQYKRVAVVTGESDGLNIEIKSGIKPDAKLRGAVIENKE